MKAKTSLLLVGILCIGLVAPAFAQSAKVEQNLQTILQRHPKLAANPSLVNNPVWQKNHPNVYAWFRHHPKARAHASQAGAWQPNGTWHEPNWWFHNNPNWVYQNHREWIQNHPAWRQNGDWDADNHVWHDRDWYQHNKPEWVKHNHPEWVEAAAEHHGHAWGHDVHKDDHHGDHQN